MMPSEAPNGDLNTYHPGEHRGSSFIHNNSTIRRQSMIHVIPSSDEHQNINHYHHHRSYQMGGEFSDGVFDTQTGNIAPSVANSKQQQPTRSSISGRSFDSIASGSSSRPNQSQMRRDPLSTSNASNKSASSFHSKSKSKKANSRNQAGNVNHKNSKYRSTSSKHKDKFKSSSKSSSFIGDRMRKVRISLLNSGLVSLKIFDKDIQTFLPKERMSSIEFERHVKLMRKYEIIATSEYRYASKYETYACRHATKESNQIKNNYKKCIPYDYNRVVLKTLPNVPDSDYVNASHIDSYLKPNAYIAAQGPNEFTIDDFWRMIWEQKTFVVVMLTKVFDFIRVMCNQYWPVELNKPEKYGQLEVTLLYEEPLADFVIRTIRLCKVQTVQSNSNTNITNDKYNRRQSTDAARQVSPEQDEPNQGDGSDDDYEDDDENNDEDNERIDDANDGNGNMANGDITVKVPHYQLNQQHQKGVPLFRQPKYLEIDVKRTSKGGDRRVSSLERRSSTANETSSNNNFTQRSNNVTPELSVSEDFVLASGHNLATGNDDAVGQASKPLRGPLLDRLVIPGQQQVLQHHLLHANSMNNLMYNTTESISQPSTPGIFLTPVTPLTPLSQLSPMTPDSAMTYASTGSGLERASATRKPVKKKKRERKRNIRPVRTQFQAPDEAALNDDDDFDDGTAANDGGVHRSSATGADNGDKQQRQISGVNERIIYQFHYHSWASHTCPSIDSLLHFRRRVRICMEEMSKSGKTGPTIVHCNDGCGRTGTYLCIDANLELAEEDGVYDVFNYTMKMRQSRKFLIDNIKQYKFVYDTIEESMLCGKTWFPVSELSQRLKHKSLRNPITKKNEYQREYEKITSRMTSKFSIGDCAGGHRVDNREKNRDVSTVPPDNFRPYLTSFQSNDNTDYINAVFVDGYTRSKEYIVTEWPMQRTISDFWSLIYDHDCNSVILLANPIDSSTYPSFLLGEKERQRKFGSVFTADKVQSNEYQNIRSWIYTINKKIMALSEVMAGMKPEPKTTQIFQITCWPQGHRVPTSTNTLVELMNMVERWRQRTTYGPVCVVSLDGKSRAGVYCAANVAIEQVVQHGEVDVFQAVKTVRRHRPQLIENMTEYKYCYDLILHYVLHYLNQNTT